MIRQLGTLVALGAASLGSAACQRPASAPAAPVVYDFVRQALAAERDGPWDLAVLGTPRAVPWQREGFVPPAELWQDEPYVWARKSATLRLPGPTDRARNVVLDLEPHPDARNQSAELFLNEQSIGRLVLENLRRRYVVAVPATPKEREALLRFSFERGTAKLPDYRRSLAAALFSAAVGPADDPALEMLAARAAPPLLSTGHEAGVPTLTQAGPGVLRFTLRMPRRAELRFTPRLHPSSARRSVTLSVGLEEAPGGEREIWRGPAGAEVVLPLSVATGTLARLSFSVIGEAKDGPIWAVWKAPRLHGDGLATAVAPAPPSVPQEPRVDALRRALANVNVVLIVLDAATASHVGAYGYARRTTPEIDRLAAEGVVFEQAFTPAVYTLPAMASLWTSRYPEEHRNVEPRTASLQRARLTLPDVLSARGIATGGFVANGMAGPGFGFDRGFSEFREIYREFGQRADADSFREVLPAWFTAHKDRRFFAYLHYREPHWPYDPKPPFNTLFGPDAPIPRDLRNEVGFFVELNNHRRQTTPDEIAHIVRLYDGNLAFVDQELGFLRRTLETEGLWDRCVVIVTADHGEEMWEHGLVGHESQLYEPALRIPLIVRFPRGSGPAGARVQGLADLLDLAPTILDLYGMGAEGAAQQAFGGRTLLPMIFGAPGKPAIVSRTRGEQPRWSLRDMQHKIIYDGALGTRQLFDLQADPGESNDLAAAEPLLAELYLQGLHRLLLDMRPQAGRTGTDRELTPEQVGNLRALGYVH